MLYPSTPAKFRTRVEKQEEQLLHSRIDVTQTFNSMQFNKSYFTDLINLIKPYFDDKPRSWSPNWKTCLSESLNTEWPKLSASTTSPPVLSIATLSSAIPTWNENKM